MIHPKHRTQSIQHSLNYNILKDVRKRKRSEKENDNKWYGLYLVTHLEAH